ncbi:MAG: TldD/PmbA family protein [Candidatus Bipolaricaulota bacterium]|nr:TldD/PmbA family protein [Candidatus Bipolaricaulota bacterium]MDW8127043.1 TldD/PmbA family protein [Candidatus Bipolaricaulota bacterium]
MPSLEVLLEKAVKQRIADELEFILIREQEGLTRFTFGHIHQNVAATDCVVYVRAWVNGRTGVAQTNDLSEAGLRRAAEEAARIAQAQTKPVGYEPPGPAAYPQINAFDEPTWNAGPELRADFVRRAVAEANKIGFNASGSLATGGDEIWIRSTRGVDAHFRRSFVRFVTVILGKEAGSGYAEFTSTRISDFRPEEVSGKALEKAARSEKRVKVEPGEYPVVLEEPAVATLLGMLSSMGFSARAVLENRSFFCQRFGEKMVSELVTVYDDALHPKTMPLPFDFEGVPKTRVYFFRRGVAEGVVHDSRTAKLMGTKSTGHALPPAAAGFSPMPTHLVMEPGEATDKELLSGLSRGLLVTRFHYARTVDPMRGIMTMMTRDGTFLVEDGRIVAAVEDLRVTESGLRALAQVQAVGKDLALITGGESFGATLVPKLRIERFAFTGRTERI